MKEVRKLRLESLFIEQLSMLISQGVVKDPRVSSFISIKDVDVAADLSLAKVRLSSFLEPAQVERAAEALNHASGFLHQELKKKLKLKSIPRLVFFADTSLKEAFALNQKIDGLLRDS